MHEKDLMIHHFTVGVAREYGLNEAVILQNIYYWVDKNATNRRHLHDGRYWTYNSAAASPNSSHTSPKGRYSTR